MKYPHVELTGRQALAIAGALEKVAHEKDYHFHALSILPSHMHAVIARHERDAEHIIGHLKFAATRRLIEEGLHPFQNVRTHSGQVPTMWTKRGWKIFLSSEEVIDSAIGYVNDNPVKEGKRVQSWAFVRPYDTPARGAAKRVFARIWGMPDNISD